MLGKENQITEMSWINFKAKVDLDEGILKTAEWRRKKQ